jgi:hypothetical protein
MSVRGVMTWGTARRRKKTTWRWKETWLSILSRLSRMSSRYSSGCSWKDIALEPQDEYQTGQNELKRNDFWFQIEEYEKHLQMHHLEPYIDCNQCEVEVLFKMLPCKGPTPQMIFKTLT